MSINKFIEYLKFERAYSVHTLTAYQKDVSSFENFVIKFYPGLSVLGVTYQHIRAWIVALAKKGVSNQSINRKISALKSFYNFFEKTGDIEINPLASHKSLKTKKNIINPFSKEEINKVSQYLKSAKTFEKMRDYLMVEMLYTTGIRRAEMIHLKISDISLENRTMKVLGKRNKERYIPLLKTTSELVGKYLKYRNEISTDNSYLFITQKGKQLYNSLVYKTIKKNFSLFSSKEKISPHIMRHTFATHLLDEGADLNVVKELLGHASLSSTQIYTHSSLAHIKEVYKKAHPRNK